MLLFHELRGIWLSYLVFSGFLMQQRQARQDSFRCIARPNSSSASILLWLFLHLHLLAFFSTSSRQLVELKWLMLNKLQKMIPFITCEISLCQYVCELGFWCQCIWFGFWGPNWLCQTTHPAALSKFNTRVSSSDFSPWWSFWSQLHLSSKLCGPPWVAHQLLGCCVSSF